MPAASNLHVSNQKGGKGRRWWTWIESGARYKWVGAIELKKVAFSKTSYPFARWCEVGMPGSDAWGGPGGSTIVIIYRTEAMAPEMFLHARTKNIGGDVNLKYPSFLLVHANRPGTANFPVFLPDQLGEVLTATAHRIKSQSSFIESASTPGIGFTLGDFYPGEMSFNGPFIGVGGAVVVDPDLWFAGKYNVGYSIRLAVGASNGQLTVSPHSWFLSTESGKVHDWVDALAKLALKNTILELKYEVLPPLVAQINAGINAQGAQVSGAYLLPGNMTFGNPLGTDAQSSAMAGVSLVLELAPN